MKPTNALSEERTIKAAENGGPLYCVLCSRGDPYIAAMKECTIKGDVISFKTKTKNELGKRKLSFWFPEPKSPRTFMFDNYFHALAYSLKLKAEHGQKAKSEERTGMAGAP